MPSVCGTKLTTAKRSTTYGGTLLEQCNGVCKYYALNIYVYKLVKLVDEKMYPARTILASAFVSGTTLKLYALSIRIV